MIERGPSHVTYFLNMYITLQLHSQEDDTIKTLEKIYDHILKSRKIVVICGAGISCSGGIPVSYVVGKSNSLMQFDTIGFIGLSI